MRETGTGPSLRGAPRARVRYGLLAAAVGGLTELLGLIWDSVAHAQDPGLAAREDLFSFGNPSHDLLAAGIAIAVLGIAYELMFGGPIAGLGRRGGTLIGAALVALLAANSAVALVSARIAPADGPHGGGPRLADDPVAQRLIATTRSHGLDVALDELSMLASKDAAVERRGHDLAHAVGEFAVGFYGTPRQALAKCRDTFLYGCYHGALKAYFEGKGRTRPADVNGICGADLGRLIYFQCLHGLGHGVLANLEWDLFRGLTYCDALRDDFERRSCYGGVFMENIVLAIDQVAGRAEADRAQARPFLRADDPLYPCDVVADRYRVSCYQLQTSGMLLYNGRDYAKTAAACDAAPAAYVPMCFESLGRDVSGDALRDDGRTIAACAALASRNKGHCFAGAVKNLLDAIERGVPFCRQVPREGKEACYRALGQQFAFVYPEPAQRSAACASAEVAYVGACEEGAKR